MRLFRLSSRAGRLAGCLVLLVGIATLTDRPSRQLAAADANESNVIPPDAGAFATIKFDDVWQSDALKDVRNLIQKELPKAAQEIESFIGLSLDDIERVSVFMPTLPSPNAREPGVGFLITAKKAYDPVKLLNALDAYSLAEIEQQRKFERPPVPKVAPPKLAPQPIDLKPFEKKPAEKKFEREPQNELPNGGFEQIQGKRIGEMRLPDLSAPFFASKRNGFLVYLVSERSFLIFPMGGRDEVGMYGYVGLLLKRSTTGNLSTSLASTAKNHVVVGVDLKQAHKLYSKMLPEQFPGHGLLSANSATLTMNIAKDVAVNLTFDCPDAETARSVEQTVNGLLTLVRDAVPQIKKEILREESMKAFSPVLDQFETAIKNATCRTTGKTVNLALSTPSESLFGTALTALVVQTRRAAERTVFMNNFKQLAIALHAFHDVHNYLPFPGMEKGGQISRDPAKATLSWRVAILPFIEEENLYRKFDLNEPWDGPTNKKLIPLMPKLFAPRKEAKLKEGETLIQTFRGPKAISPRAGFATFSDGLSNTYFFVEGGEGVVWTKPDDIPFDVTKDVPKLGGNFNGDFIASMADGSIRFVERRRMTEAILKQYIMPADGQPIRDER